MINSRDRILPDQDFGWHFGSEVTGAGSHIAMRQFEPGTCEGVGELIRVFIEPAGYFFVGRIHAQGDVRGEHGRGVRQACHVCIGYGAGTAAVLRLPLMRACWALGEFPLEAEEVLEIIIAPLGGGGCPCSFQTASDGVLGVTCSEGIVPAHALLLDGGGSRFATYIFGRIGSAVGLSEGVSAGDQRHGLFVVHCHAAEGFADIAGGCQRIGIAVRAFRVNIDKTHLNGCKRVLEVTVAAVALIAQPIGLGTPVDVFFRFPDVFATTTETKSLEAHGFQGAVTCEDHKIRPGEFLSVFLLHWPEEQTGLVEVGIVGPAVQRSEALGAGAAATTSVGDAVRTRTMPGHADDEGAIMTVVGRPPVLGCGQGLDDVLLHFSEVERLERLSIVKILIHRIGQGGMLTQDVQFQLIRPPVTVSCSAARAFLGGCSRKRAFRFSASVVGRTVLMWIV